MEADALGVVRALSHRHGVEFSDSILAHAAIRGADADWQFSFVLVADVAGDAEGEPVSQLLADRTRSRLEERSAGSWRCGRRTCDICRHI